MDDNQLTLTALQDFVYCPMRYWWRQVAHQPEPLLLDRVVHTLFRESLWEYARIYWVGAKPVPDVVQQALRASPDIHPLQIIMAILWGYRFIEWGQAELGRLVRQYSRADAAIVLHAIRGRAKYRRPDGPAHTAPRLTKTYRESAEKTGLPEMRWRIDAASSQLPIELRKGQSLADTYARANGEVVANLVAGLPDWEGKALEVDVPFVAQVEGLELTGRADFLIQVGPKPELVFLQYGPSLLPFKACKNDLGVIAALVSAGERWKPGEMSSVRVFNVIDEVKQAPIYGPGRQRRLEVAVDLVKRGIQAGAYLPRFLSYVMYKTCQTCPYQALCTDGGGEMLERMDPAGYQASQSISLS